MLLHSDYKKVTIVNCNFEDGVQKDYSHIQEEDLTSLR